MSSLSFRRAAAALVLGLTLLSPWASASELRSHAAHRNGPTVTQEVRGVFGQLWGALASIWSKAGVSIDPNGLLSSPPATSSSVGFCDNGMSIDPDGRCSRSTVTADNGCSGDPNGRCTSGH
jgi:hypothetical protein